jgi:hypothetical protein
LDTYTIVALVIYCLFLAYSIITTIAFGEGNLDYYDVRGPYQVGHKDDFNSTGNAISVYYPMNVKEYNNNLY